MKIEVFKGHNKEWFFRLVARNGRKIAQSEGYKQRAHAIKTAKRIKRDAIIATIEIIAP